MSPPLTLPVTGSDVTTSSWTTGTAQTVPVPSGLQDGDTVTIFAYDQVAASTITAAGFTARYHTTATSTRGWYEFTKKVTSAATDLAGVNYSITLSASGRGCALASRCPIISATPIDASPVSDVYNASAASTIAVPGVTVGHPDAVVLLGWFGNGTGSVTATGTATGYTVVGQTNCNNAGSTSSIGVLQGNPGSGATGTITVTLSASMASSGGFAISMLPTPNPAGIASAEAFGTPSVSVSGGTQTVSPSGIASAEAVGTPTLIYNQTLSPTGIPSAEAFGLPRVTTWVDQWLALPTPPAAHRNGCWGTYGEETLAGYAFAATWSPKLALEASVWPTTDGVFVLSHDKQTARVFSGADLDITASTWASLSAKTTLVGGNPIARLDDLLAAQATGTRVFLVDNKGQTSNSALLDLLDSYGGPARFIIKGYINSTTWADAAAARGYMWRWGYGFQADVTRTSDSVIGGVPNNFSTNQSHWTLLGMDQAANAASWTYSLSFGKLIISDELATAAQKANALSLGATGIMSSDITQTVPSNLILSPTGIASGEAFGAPVVTPGPLTVAPTGIASQQAFGTPAISPGGVTASPSGIPSGEALGVPTVAPGPVTVAPVGIASVGAFGVPVVTPGGVAVSPIGIASTEAFGTPSVSVTGGPQTASPAGIASAEAVGTPVIARGPVTVSPASIGTGAAFGVPTVSNTGAAVVSPVGIASGEAFGNVVVSGGAAAARALALVATVGTDRWSVDVDADRWATAPGGDRWAVTTTEVS